MSDPTPKKRGPGRPRNADKIQEPHRKTQTVIVEGPDGKPRKRTRKDKEKAAAARSAMRRSRDEIIALAHKTGAMPHEFMLAVMRGEPVEQAMWNEELGDYIIQDIYPDFETRLDCAKACASFFTPKLSTQNVDNRGDATQVSQAIRDLAKKLPV